MIYGSGSGSRRANNIRIRLDPDPDPQHWFHGYRGTHIVIVSFAGYSVTRYLSQTSDTVNCYMALHLTSAQFLTRTPPAQILVLQLTYCPKLRMSTSSGTGIY